MSCALSAYTTGIAMETGEQLEHPGGMDLTCHALQRAALPCAAHVIDLGCGSGASVRLLLALGLQATGIDRRPREENGEHLPILCARAEELPFPDASADAILAECSLSVTEEPERVLAECARVLAPGGRLILCDLYARNAAAIEAVRGLENACIRGMFVREELEARLDAAGFALALWEDHSRALSEFAVRLLFGGSSLASLWGSTATGAAAAQIESALKAVRAGYFLCVATRRLSKRREG